MKNRKQWLGDQHKAKKKFEDYKKKKVVKDFWNKEYSGDGENFALSENVSGDFEKFVNWFEREFKGQNPINTNTFFVDTGCGNGRNGLFLYENFGAKGVGYDLSKEAISTAKKNLRKILTMQEMGEVSEEDLPVHFFAQNLSEKIPVPDGKADLVIDAVASHVLRKEEREFFKKEVVRVLSSGSYYFLKSLLLDSDYNAKKMVREFGAEAGEENSYIHPTIGIFEHVPTEEELVKFYSDDFDIEKIDRSFVQKNKPNKRRYIVMYLRKK